MIVVRQHYRGFGLAPVVVAALIQAGGALGVEGLKLWQQYMRASEAEKARIWESMGATPEFRRRYEALWAQQAAALEPPPAATSALPGWVWPVAGATAVLIVLGGIALALRRE